MSGQLPIIKVVCSKDEESLLAKSFALRTLRPHYKLYQEIGFKTRPSRAALIS